MKGFALGLSLSIAFIAGCLASRFVVPPVMAGTNPQRWEYFCIDEIGVINIVQKANPLGAQGWEMVGSDGIAANNSWCFKRPLP